MVSIRKGERKDIPALLKLIQELADYENASKEVEMTEDQLLQDGFGENPSYSFLVAEEKEIIIGISLFYFRYSTWKGKTIYLEDLIVTQPQRRKGIGKMLFEETIETGKSLKCSGMSWQVLEWNAASIRFYKKNQTCFDDEWLNCRLNF